MGTRVLANVTIETTKFENIFLIKPPKRRCVVKIVANYKGGKESNKVVWEPNTIS